MADAGIIIAIDSHGELAAIKGHWRSRYRRMREKHIFTIASRVVVLQLDDDQY